VEILRLLPAERLGDATIDWCTMCMGMIRTCKNSARRFSEPPWSLRQFSSAQTAACCSQKNAIPTQFTKSPITDTVNNAS
jgi:hypothetical protein